MWYNYNSKVNNLIYLAGEMPRGDRCNKRTNQKSVSGFVRDKVGKTKLSRPNVHVGDFSVANHARDSDGRDSARGSRGNKSKFAYQPQQVKELAQLLLDKLLDEKEVEEFWLLLYWPVLLRQLRLLLLMFLHGGVLGLAKDCPRLQELVIMNY